MSEFRIFETEEFQKKMGRLTPPESQRVQRKLADYVYPQLRKDPFFGSNIRKLRGYSPNTWRYRIGQYRIFYTVDAEDNIVCILSIDLRRDAYR